MEGFEEKTRILILGVAATWSLRKSYPGSQVCQHHRMDTLNRPICLTTVQQQRSHISFLLERQLPARRRWYILEALETSPILAARASFTNEIRRHRTSSETISAQHYTKPAEYTSRSLSDSQETSKICNISLFNSQY